MAEIVFSSAVGDGPFVTYTAGGTLTQGMALYFDTSTRTVKAADADAEASAECIGFAGHAAASGQPVAVQSKAGSRITVNSSLTKGVPYFLGISTPGSICLYSDISTGDYVSFVGIAISATVLEIGILNSGVVI